MATLEADGSIAIAKQWLNTLIKDWIYKNKNKIFALFNEFPSIKETTLSDIKFQKNFFNSLKEKYLEWYLKNNKKDYHLDSIDFEWLSKYAQQYDFIKEKIVWDQDIQEALSGAITYSIQWLKDIAKDYDDEECTEYQSDRLRSLLQLQNIYKNIWVLKPEQNVKEHNALLLDMLAERTWRRAWGVRYPKILELVRLAWVTEQDISTSVINGWKEYKYHPVITNLEEFPKTTLQESEIQDQIANQFLNYISGTDISSAESLLESYKFLQEYIKEYNILINKIPTTQEPLCDIENKTIRSLKSSLHRPFERKARSKYGNDIVLYFPNIKSIFQQKEIEKLVSLWWISDSMHDKEYQKNYISLIPKLWLSQEESIWCIQEYFNTRNNLDINSHIKELETLLTRFFPWQNTDEIFKEELKKRSEDIAGIADTEKRNTIILSLWLSETDVESKREDLYVESFKKNLQDTIKSKNTRYGGSILDTLNWLENSKCDIEVLKGKIKTDEIKNLFSEFAQMQMSDSSYDIDFWNDEARKKLSKHSLFPLSYEEVKNTIIELAIQYTNDGYSNGIARMKKNYSIINPLIENDDERFINAGIDRIIKFIWEIDKYDLEHKIFDIRIFIREFAGLKDHRTDNSIQEAIINKANEFLQDWNVELYQEVKQYENLEEVLK